MFLNLQKQLFLLRNQRIWKKMVGGRPFRLRRTFEHSAKCEELELENNAKKLMVILIKTSKIWDDLSHNISSCILVQKSQQCIVDIFFLVVEALCYNIIVQIS